MGYAGGRVRRGAVGWTAFVIALALIGAAVAGCGGTSELTGGSPTTAPAVTISTTGAAAYLSGLRTAQSGLARAEATIPANPRTPAALARSIRLLAGAVGRLAAGLEALHPPAIVEGAHRRLIAIVRSYEARLTAIARTAAKPGGRAVADTTLVSATETASRRFTAVVAQINGVLK
jgi:hypothetical protein